MGEPLAIENDNRLGTRDPASNVRRHVRSSVEFPVPLREDLFVMTDREWLLKLAEALHTTLDIEKQLSVFAAYAAEQIRFDSVRYTHADTGIDVMTDPPAAHRASYDLFLDDEALGSLTFSRKQPFSEKELTSLEDLLANFLHPLRNALRYRDALQAAAHDPLTGLSNRATLETALEREVKMAKRHDLPLSVVMIDADHFKSINDSFGHQAGDKVLRILANCIKDSIRDSDLLFRYGGEEFVALLGNTGLAGARLLAERICTAVSALSVTLSDQPIPVTVSVGLAALDSAEDPGELLNRADRAMYQAKRQGRNRVVDERQLSPPPASSQRASSKG